MLNDSCLSIPIRACANYLHPGSGFRKSNIKHRKATELSIMCRGTINARTMILDLPISTYLRSAAGMWDWMKHVSVSRMILSSSMSLSTFFSKKEEEK